MRELTERQLNALEFLGDFEPTTIVENCEIKGYMDGKVYLNSTDLRDLADNLNSIAQWLDERATEAETKEQA